MARDGARRRRGRPTRQANEIFHNAIYDGTQNAYLAEITLDTRMRLQPFRRAQFGALGRLPGLACRAFGRRRGDPARRPQAAEAAMRAHIGQVEEAWHEVAGGAQEPAATKARQEP